MSRYEEDDCEVNLQLRLKEINRKAKRAQVATQVDCSGLECEEIPYEEVLHYANSTESEFGDEIRDRVIDQIIKEDNEVA